MDMQAQASAYQPDANLCVAPLAEDHAFGQDGIAAFKFALADRIIVLRNGELLVEGRSDEVMASDFMRDVCLGKSPEHPEELFEGHPPRTPPTLAQHADESGMCLLTLIACAPASANTRCCTAFRPSSRRAGSSCCSGATGLARPPPSVRSWGGWRPSPGSVRFRGEGITGLRTAGSARHGIGYFPENSGAFGGLTVKRPFARDRGSPLRPGPTCPDQGIVPQGSAVFWTKPARALSGGRKRMLAVARASIAPRASILVDDPTKGLAPAIVAEMAEAFREIAATTTILPAERNFDFTRAFGDRMAVIEDGRIAHAGSMAGFVADTALPARLLSPSP